MLLTFDYELFLGKKSGSVDNCLIKPTKLIRKLLNSHKCKGYFFVDLTYLAKLKSIKNKYNLAFKDFEKIKNQLKELSSDGHEIFWHIHPHWIDANYIPEINQWDLSNKRKFSIKNLKINEVDSIFRDAYKILRDLNLHKKAIGYRAGGLYIQPFLIVKKQFKKYRIKYDFSVLKGAYSQSSNGKYAFDFTNCPDDMIYTFNDNITEKSENGEFKEIALEQIEINGVRKIINGLHYRLNKNKIGHKIYGDGSSSGNTINLDVKKSLSDYLMVKETISIELMNPIRNGIYFSYLKNKSFQHFISHPKLISDYNLQQFDSYLKKITKKFSLITDIKKIIE